MKLDIETIKENWSTYSIIFALITSLIYFVIENKIANKTIATLSESNKVLSEKVASLEGSRTIVSDAVKMFMENPPGQLNYRITNLENRVFGYGIDSIEIPNLIK